MSALTGRVFQDSAGETRNKADSEHGSTERLHLLEGKVPVKPILISLVEYQLAANKRSSHPGQRTMGFPYTYQAA